MRRILVSFIIQLSLLGALALFPVYAFSQNPLPSDSLGTGPADSLKPAVVDSSRQILLDSLQRQSDFEFPIQYSAKDSMILDMNSKSLLLKVSGQMEYDKMTMKADSIAVNWENSVLTAKGLVDSTGQVTGQPVFEESDQTYKARSINYNFKTQRGIVDFARTRQGEDYIIGTRVKKDGEQTYYIKDGKFTTCDLEHPHYYIRSSKLKIIPGDKIITGPLMLVIEDFPLPIIVPFGFFPNKTGKSSGVVLPTYGESADRGFFLRNLGYYFSINDYFDLLIDGDIFTRGGYRIAVGTDYRKRYRYSGNLKFEYGVQRFGEVEDPTYSRNTNFFVTWTHDQTINPTTRLTARVNGGSSKFLRANSYNDQDFLTNTLVSNISLTKNFSPIPMNLTMNLDHNQNTETGQITLGLPNIALTRSRFYPLKRKRGVGKERWYEKIGATYTANIQNSITFTDTLFDDIFLRSGNLVRYVTYTGQDSFYTSQRKGDYFRNGMRQSLPINTSFSIAKYINISPGLNYNEYWYLKTVEKTWDEVDEEVKTNTVPGFATSRDFRFDISASTRIYGIFNFKKNKRGLAFRHTILPNIGYNYKPDFSTPGWGFFDEVQSDTAGTTLTYSRFEGQVYTGPSAGESQSINFGINNILEGKIKPKDFEESDSTAGKDPFTRFNVLDALQLSSSYNFAADSLKLSPFAFTARTNMLVFGNKFNILLTGAMDPYTINDEGRRVNTFRYDVDGKLARLTNLNLTLTSTFRSKRRVGEDAKKAPKEIPEDELAHVLYYRDLYVDFTVPWSLNFTLNANYRNSGLTRDTTVTLNFSGDVNLTPKWKIGFTSGYDFSNSGFSYTSVTIYRDLHCWELSMNWIPFGERKSYNLAIGVKSATLKDLKLTKRRDWQDRFRDF